MADAVEIEVAMDAHPVTDIDVSDLCRQFEDAFDVSEQERALAEQCLDYYNNDQLTDEELDALAKRGQPPVISNRIGPKIDALLGYERKRRRDPKAYPRTPQHADDADSVTDAVRFVCDENKFDQIRSAGAKDLLIQGLCAATVVAELKNGKPEVRIHRVPWDRYYRDPYSREPDFSDASFHGVVLWMDEKEAQARFPGHEEQIEGCYSQAANLEDTYGDRPKVAWGDRQRKRVRVLQHRFVHEGEWWTCVFCKGGFLREPQVSPYVDEDGTPVCDLIAASANIDRENRRYGAVKRMLSPQDEINKRRSKALHLLNSKQIIAERGAVDSVAEARKEAAKPDGYMEVNQGMRFDFVEQNQLIAGQFELLQESKNEIDASGVNPYIEGDGQAPSGRAQELMVQAGLSEMSGLFEALKHWNWEVYRQVWYRIRQFWTEQRWVRVTDDPRNVRWVAVNQPITRGELLQAQAEEAGEAFEADPNDPMMQEVVGMRNQLSELGVDIILEDGPDTVTIQAEQFDKLVNLKRADPNAIPTEAIIQASDLRNKEQILKHLESNGIPEQVQQQMQAMQQAMQQLQQQLQAAERKIHDKRVDHLIDAMKVDIDRAKLAEATASDRADASTDRYKAETERIKALGNPDTNPPPGGFFNGR